MKHIFLPLITCLALMFCLSGCIMAARKGLGTIQGPHGSMTIIDNKGSIDSSETIELVRIQNLVGGSFRSLDSRILKGAIESSLSKSGYLQGQDGDLVMLVQITDFTDRPAKKELRLRVEISRYGERIAVAELNSDLNGFGSQDSVAEAIGRACVRFLQEIPSS